MNITIAGGGSIGSFLCSIFSQSGHKTTVIENNGTLVRELDDKLSSRVVQGDYCDIEVLRSANLDNCDFFISTTTDYYSNLVASSIAKKIGAKKTISRVNSSFHKYNSEYCKNFNIDFLIHPETLCAVEIAKIIRNPGRVAVENFALGQIEVQHFFVSEKSKLLNKQLEELKLSSDIRILYIKRGEHSQVPTKNSFFLAGDQVTVVGNHDNISEFRSKLSADKKDEEVSIGIFSVSEISIALLKLLHDKKYHIKLIERNREKCENIAKLFPHITVINGDASSIDILKNEGFGFCDFFVACSEDDETNTMIAIQSKHIGAKHVSLALNESDYEDVLTNIKERVGIDQIVSRRESTARELFTYVSDKNYATLAHLNEQNLIFTWFNLKHGSKIIGKEVKNLGLPSGSIIVSIMRNYIASVPKACDVIQENDEIITISSNDNLDLLKKIIL